MKATEEKISSIISRLRSDADMALENHRNKCQYINEVSQIGIELNSKTAVSNVADILRQSKNNSDELYASLQSIIVSADEQCRPLIEKDPDPASINMVSKFIIWINSESNIVSSYNASLNQNDLGTVAEVSYSPSLSSRMIQKYWEEKCSQYISILERIEINNSEKDRYKAAYESWAAQLDEIKAERDKNFEYHIDLAKKQFINDECKKLSDNISSYKADIQIKKVEISNAQNVLNSLGAFRFSEKNHQKSIILKAQYEIKALEDKINTINQKYNTLDTEINKKLKDEKKIINDRLKTEFPYPPKPKTPISLKEDNIKEDYTRAGVKAYYSEIILDNLQENYGMDIPSLLSVPELSEFNSITIDRILRTLMLDGSIVRETENRKIYFYLNKEY